LEAQHGAPPHHRRRLSQGSSRSALAGSRIHEGTFAERTTHPVELAQQWRSQNDRIATEEVTAGRSGQHRTQQTKTKTKKTSTVAPASSFDPDGHGRSRPTAVNWSTAARACTAGGSHVTWRDRWLPQRRLQQVRSPRCPSHFLPPRPAARLRSI